MGLKDITKAAVESAIAEHDELGADVFLATYGYARSKEYWLVHDGKRYASKAIASVAQKFVIVQPLKWVDFCEAKTKLFAVCAN
jgi:hypothetical protein